MALSAVLKKKRFRDKLRSSCDPLALLNLGHICSVNPQNQNSQDWKPVSASKVGFIRGRAYTQIKTLRSYI